jgi:hypothetical protein
MRTGSSRVLRIANLSASRGTCRAAGQSSTTSAANGAPYEAWRSQQCWTRRCPPTGPPARRACIRAAIAGWLGPGPGIGDGGGK